MNNGSDILNSQKKRAECPKVNEMQLVLLQCRCHEVSPIPYTPIVLKNITRSGPSFFLLFSGCTTKETSSYYVVVVVFFLAENYLFQKVAGHLKGEGVHPTSDN